jgi:lipopolysaccharide biosynthesis glycosyltransferase
MRNNEINIVCTIDNNYVVHCTVMLQSLFYNNNTNSQFKIFIIHNGLTKKNQKILSLFIKSRKHTCQFILIDERQIENASITDHISIATYFRILIPEVVPSQFKKVIFLDSDMIITEDISELWKENIDDYALAATLEYISCDYKLNLGMRAESNYFNAGVLLMNLEKWRNENKTKQILKYIKDHHAMLLTWDQDALNVIFENGWKKIALKWNVGHNFFRSESLHKYFDLSESEYNNLKKHPGIIHFSGSSKPWDYFNTHPLKNEYIKYRKMTPWKRVKLIGEPGLYDKSKFLFKKILKKYVWNSGNIPF